MKRLLLGAAAVIMLPILANAQCSTSTNQSAGCTCEDGTNNCDLLPDLGLSWWALLNYLNGPTEYSQTGNGANNGRLRISGSTPNIGHGPLTVMGTSLYVCGDDTLTSYPGSICPDGNPPRQLIVQRIYQKNANGTMTYYDRYAGAMTYHPTHGHNHVDDWVTFTLRIEDPNDPNPLNWPIVGNGAKLGFCLMDYGTCSYYNNHCKDDNTTYLQGTTMNNSAFPNYGLGGGSYNCSPVIQGISSGYTDIYSKNLDQMWIDIPPGTCNGDYWIVGLVDPSEHFLEEDETNNWTAVPFTLTQQSSGNFQASISSPQGLTVCQGDSIMLTATPGLFYDWSNGSTAQSIYVKESGQYYVTVTSLCGTSQTTPVTISVSEKPEQPTAADQEICAGQVLTLTATGSEVHWFDANMAEIGIGNSIDVTGVMASSMFYAQDHLSPNAVIENVGKVDNAEGGFYSTATASLVFNTFQACVLKSVKVYAQSAGTFTIRLKNNLGQLIDQKTVAVAAGEHRVYVNFDLPVGTGYYLEGSGSNMPPLFRANEGLNFPYTLSNFVTIIAPTTAYNYFFDWEVLTSGNFCPSDLEPVNVTVNCFLSLDDMDVDAYLNVYPNPARTDVNVSFTLIEASSANLVMTNLLGAEVYEKTLSENTTFHENIDLSNLQKGVYLIQLQVGSKTYTRKLVIN